MRFRPSIHSIFIASACVVLAPSLSVLHAQTAENASKPATHGINVANMDRSVTPGDNFYMYANGDWIKRTAIPADRAGIGVFSTLDDTANKNTAALIQESAKANAPAGSEARKIADLYNSYMDESAIEAKGLTPLHSQLAAIAAIHNQRDLARALGESLRADVDPLNNTNFHTENLFGLWVAPGFHDPEHYHAYLLQGGLELPDREYYLGDSAHMKEIQAKYQTHVAAMFRLAGFDDADARATRVIALEKAIAQTHTSLADDEDIHKADNTWKRSEFAAKAPGLDWTEYFRAAKLADQDSFIVWQPSAFTGEAALVASTPVDTWKDWLAYHFIEQYAGVLPKALADERFDFFGKTLVGVPQQRPRAQRGVFVVDGLLGDAVGKIYAQRYFSPEAKAAAEAMVANIIAAYRVRIEALTWMAPATKAEAEAKLNALYVGVGYPETWHSYDGYEVKPDDIFGNVWRAGTFYYHQQIDRLGKTVDRKEWSMTPQTVNAVNLPLAGRAQLSCGHSAAALLRCESSRGSQLWSDRVGHRT